MSRVAVTFLTRLPGVAVRIASVAAGALILKHEVYDSDSAQLVVIGLGMWLIGVPPALWLDTLRRAGTQLGQPTPAHPPDPPPDARRRDDAAPRA